MIDMRKLMTCLLALLGGVSVFCTGVRADDIDIFLGAQGNTVNAPNIIFVIDNTDNWSSASQKWPDAPTQGQAEVAAINTELNAIKSSMPANVGLAMLSSYSGSGANGATPGVGGTATPTGTGAPQGRRVDAAQFFGCQAVTPETEKTSHYFFQQSHGFALDDPGVTEKLAQSVLAGFEEDRDIILAQQQILDLAPDSPMLAMRMDVALASFRSMLEKAIAEECGGA